METKENVAIMTQTIQSHEKEINILKTKLRK